MFVTVLNTPLHLTLSWRRPLSYRNQSIDLLCKSMDWFLYGNGLRHERVNWRTSKNLQLTCSLNWISLSQGWLCGLRCCAQNWKVAALKLTKRLAGQKGSNSSGGFLQLSCEKLTNFSGAIDQFKTSVPFHLETSHLICNVNQMTGFYMKGNTGLKWVNTGWPQGTMPQCCLLGSNKTRQKNSLSGLM